MSCPDFDTTFFPTIETSYRVDANNGIAKLQRKLFGKLIHHRWSLVKDSYRGFSIEEDFKFSKLWSRTPNLQSKNYISLSHWLDITLKKVFRFYGVRSIRELIIRN